MLTFLTFSFISCEKSQLVTEQPAKVIGEWEMYTNEKLESTLDQWTGTEWTLIDKWFKFVRANPVMVLEFKEDGTFEDRYAGIITGRGLWKKTDNNHYSFEYIQDPNKINSRVQQKRHITFYCDTTYSVQVEEDHSAIYYYKEIGNTECSQSVPYKVTD